MSSNGCVEINGVTMQLNKIVTGKKVIPQSRVVAFSGDWTVLRSPKGILYKVSK